MFGGQVVEGEFGCHICVVYRTRNCSPCIGVGDLIEAEGWNSRDSFVWSGGNKELRWNDDVERCSKGSGVDRHFLCQR